MKRLITDEQIKALNIKRTVQDALNHIPYDLLRYRAVADKEAELNRKKIGELLRDASFNVVPQVFIDKLLAGELPE